MAHYRSGRAAIDEGVYPTWTNSGSICSKSMRTKSSASASSADLSATRRHQPRVSQRPRAAQARERNRRRRRAPAPHLHPQPECGAGEEAAGMSVCTHMCRGNFRSSWVASGGYDFVAEALFTQLNVDGFFLEYDDARSGTFAPLRFVPKNKMVVLGLVTTKKAALEKKTISSVASMKLRNMFRSNRSASAPNVASRPRWKATCSPLTMRLPS